LGNVIISHNITNNYGFAAPIFAIQANPPKATIYCKLRGFSP